MARLLENKKGFKIIKLTWRETVCITDSWGLSDCCGQNSSEEPLFYIAVLDRYFCECCMNAWLSGATRYKSDIEKEQYNFVKVKNKLKDLGTWSDERDLEAD